MVMSDDADDLSSARAGEQEGFLRLYDRQAGIVLSLCRRQSWSLEEAEDASQEVFLRAFRMLDKVESPERFGPWLYRIARHVCNERRRAARRRMRHEQKAAMNRMLEPPKTATPIEAAERAEQLERLTLALEGLPDNQRLAIHLYYLEADPVVTASKLLGLSRQGFYKLLAKARERLACLMREGQTA